LDALETTTCDGVYKLTAEQLQDHFSENKLTLGLSTISIFGDWEGRLLNAKHELEGIEFNVKKNILTIIFLDDYLLKVRNPRLIFVSSTYLKIVKATEVMWQTKDDLQYSYLIKGNKIETKSNTDWKPHQYDIGIGMNAVYLQG
ncbi:hypothetical protein, partial [Crocinitomix catalasitica]|uniref:hypothetical protein n=1 Tax=Crocinitomix catalasitica TaxID=184607 RepID=UPI00146FC605